MANYKIEQIEGIGPAFGAKLKEAGVTTTDKYFKACRTKADRKALALETGIDEAKILKWANMADLFRIKGIGAQYAELLEAAGVDTVMELKQRNAENLTEKMAEVNAEKKLVRLVPALKSVKNWVAQAKELPRGLEY